MRSMKRRMPRLTVSALFVDQVTSSASNVLLVLCAARAMDTDSFAVFSTYQLVIVTLIGVGRMAIFIPALSTQRHGGRRRIPGLWTTPVALGLTFAGAPLAAWILARGGDLTPALMVTLCAIPVFVYLQDGLRYVRLSESRVGLVLASDSAWIILTVPGVVVWGSDLLAASFFWALGATVGVVILLLPEPSELPTTNWREAWRVGKWGLVDAALAGLVIAGPTVAALALFDQTLVATYRVIQSAMAPLNLVNSVLVVSFGLGAWKFGQPDAAQILRRRVRRITARLFGLTTFLLVTGIPASLWFAGISLQVALTPWVVVAIASVAGTWMSARQAASQALGMQHIGALTRMVSASFVILVLILSARSGAIADPIGTTLIGTTLVGLLGSQAAFRRGLANLSRTVRPVRPGLSCEQT